MKVKRGVGTGETCGTCENYAGGYCHSIAHVRDLGRKTRALRIRVKPEELGCMYWMPIERKPRGSDAS